MAFEPKTITLKDGNTATVGQRSGAGGVSSFVQFSIPAAPSTQSCMGALDLVFKKEVPARFDSTGLFSVQGEHGQRICDILEGKDKGPGDNDPPPPPPDGEPVPRPPEPPFSPGSSLERYRTMGNSSGTTSIGPSRRG